jgi:dolichyl-diphosphooligosaccharide--protein glycosyltransferase/undecaprenyl-diphosphooligosaccharide--protein glycosyltransferase
MINNVDGYFYGSGAQKILYGMHEYNPRLLGVWGYGTAVITAFVVKFFPFISLDTAMLYLPPIISSLVVIPIILIGKLYGNLLWGFLAALIGSIGWSYYNRTLAGYYDTDMFSASLPMFILFFLLAGIKKKSLKYIFTASLIFLIYPWLYDQGKAIVYAMGILTFLYLLVFYRNEDFTYKTIILFSIALMPINPWVKLVLLIAVFIGLKRDYPIKQLQIAALVAFLGFFFSGNVLGLILSKVLSYSTSTTKFEGLKFLNVNKTVREAGNIPWYIVFDRIIGSSIGLVIAIIGYILLVKRYKEFIIALPLWGIGFFAFIGGLRFTVYAVPIAALSGVYFFVYLSEKLKVKNEKLLKLVPILGSLFLIAPNLTHIFGCCENSKLLAEIEKVYPLRSYPYLVPTTFNKNEVEVLDKLKQKSNPKDYVITWWDYGYPIWYYANVNTLIDGGKHNEDNFLVSKILTTSNPTLAYNLSKLSIKTYVDTNKTVATQLFIKNKKPINVNEFLAMVGSDTFKAPKLDRDVYLMLPFRMLNIFSTVSVFSNRNLNTGEVYPQHFFYKGSLRQSGPILYIGNLTFDLRRGILSYANQQIPVKKVDIVSYAKNGKLIKKSQVLRDKGLNLIIMPSYRIGLVLDNYYYNSTFIQMFVFENYNKKLFEPLILSPVMKIYKLK